MTRKLRAPALASAERSLTPEQMRKKEPLAEKKTELIKDTKAARKIREAIDKRLAEGEDIDDVLSPLDSTDQYIINMCVYSEENLSRKEAADAVGMCSNSLDYRMKSLARRLAAKRQKQKGRDEEIYGISFTVRGEDYLSKFSKLGED